MGPYSNLPYEWFNTIIMIYKLKNVCLSHKKSVCRYFEMRYLNFSTFSVLYVSLFSIQVMIENNMHGQHDVQEYK